MLSRTVRVVVGVAATLVIGVAVAPAHGGIAVEPAGLVAPQACGGSPMGCF